MVKTFIAARNKYLLCLERAGCSPWYIFWCPNGGSAPAALPLPPLWESGGKREGGGGTAASSGSFL